MTVSHADVIAKVRVITQLAESRGLLPAGSQLALQKGSPSNGIQWRLTGREVPNGGLIVLDFLPDQGWLGNSAKDAWTRLGFTQAALKAFPQTGEKR